LLILSGFFGIAGQLAITWGYTYIRAREGGIISTSKILFATVLGYLIFDDPISLSIVLGGLLICIAMAGVSLKGI
jgi:drug/metabolite transporter (DMT)-like permease